MNHHGQWLDPSLEVHHSEVRWYFIADFYDGPISGLAHYAGRVVGFCCFQEDIPDQQIFVLHELSALELGEELRVKAKFEALVGTHWSFNEVGEPLATQMRDETLTRRFYLEESPLPEAFPESRPIIGWFSLAD